MSETTEQIQSRPEWQPGGINYRLEQIEVSVFSSRGVAAVCADAIKELDSLRARLAECEKERDQLRSDAEVLAGEVNGWRENAEDTHDTNYGHCRPGCTKCEGKRRAWQLAAATDASGALSRHTKK